jgi:hypothetical protein
VDQRQLDVARRHTLLLVIPARLVVHFLEGHLY